MKYLVIIISTLVIAGTMCSDVRVPRQAQHQQQQQQPQKQNYQEPVVNYRPLNQAPAGIQQLLQLQQAREPLIHIPAQPAPNFGATPSQPQYNPLPAPAPPHQQQQPQYNPAPLQHQQQQQPQYNPAPLQQQQQQQQQQPYRPQYSQQQLQQPQQPQYQG